jgi:ABC-type multidrug transport system fused ATPase/permease subunit
MKQLLFYLKQLNAFSGRKLYINLLCMVLVSFIEGTAILLLIPLLNLAGILHMNMGNVVSIPWVTEMLRSFPNSLSLPVILEMYIFMVIGESLLLRYQSILHVKIEEGFTQYLRLETYRALLQSKWKYFLGKRKSDINHVLTSEIERVGLGTNFFLNFLAALIFMAIQIVIAFCLSAKLTILIIGCGIVLSVPFRKFIKDAKRLGSQTSEVWQSYYAEINEHLNGIKDIKSNALEVQHLKRFESLSNELESNVVNFVKVNSRTQFLYKTVAAILLSFLILSSKMVFHISSEQLLLVIVIFTRIWPRFTAIQSSLQHIAAMLPAFQSLTQLRQECQDAQERRGDEEQRNGEPMPFRQGIDCQNVYFSYGESGTSFALMDTHLHIPANRTTAIVGRSGAGKSTLIDLLMGLIQPNEGQVLMDGNMLTGHNLHLFRQSISYVPQDPFLFNASIRENLLLVKPDANEYELWEALKFAACDEFVASLPSGLKTVIGDRGIKLSGGERQRLVLARAILRKPAILFLDEATSALDSENEEKIQNALDRLKGTMTIVVIAHRLSTIRNADQVIVLDHGKVIQQGGFHQLGAEKAGMFSHLLRKQGIV